jgi:hypothetical protein
MHIIITTESHWQLNLLPLACHPAEARRQLYVEICFHGRANLAEGVG